MWPYRFAEMGGYDCMTDAFYIKGGTEPLSPTIAVLDFSDFGQKRCQPAPTETREKADAAASKIVRAVNSHDMLIDAIQRAADMLPANAACGVLRAALKKVQTC